MAAELAEIYWTRATQPLDNLRILPNYRRPESGNRGRIPSAVRLSEIPVPQFATLAEQ